MKLGEYKTEDLMLHIEEGLAPDRHYYTMTHSLEDPTKVYEIYFKDNKWMCRQKIGFQPNMDGFEQFSKEVAEDYFSANKLCLDHFTNDMIQNILMKVMYHEMMIEKTEKLMGKNVVDAARVEFGMFKTALTDAVKKLTRPKLEVIKGDGEDETLPKT